MTMYCMIHNYHSRLDAELCAESCVKLFASCMSFLLSQHSVVRTTAMNTMKVGPVLLNVKELRGRV